MTYLPFMLLSKQASPLGYIYHHHKIHKQTLDGKQVIKMCVSHHQFNCFARIRSMCIVLEMRGSVCCAREQTKQIPGVWDL